MSNTPHFRAYINPQPALSESEQRTLVEKYQLAESYVQTRVGGDREAWITSLREGNIALVPELFVLAKAIGRKDSRFADLLKAERLIQDRGAVLMEASSGHSSSDKRHWPAMRDRAHEMLGNAVKKGKVGKQPLGYTDQELESIRGIIDSKNFKNWTERAGAIVARGIKLPGRTWCYNTLPKLTNHLGVVVPLPPQRKRSSLVYFIKDGDKVKIGHSIKPTVRMTNLETHSKLELLLTLPGGHNREKQLHKKFHAFRVKGEWFNLVPEIASYIAGAKKRKQAGKGHFVRRRPK